MKRFSGFIVLLLLFGLLTGCNTKTPSAENPSSEKEPSGSFEISLSQAELEKQAPSTLAAYTAAQTKADASVAKAVLLSQKEIIEESSYPDRYVSYETEDGSHLTVTVYGSVSYVTNHYLEKLDNIVKRRSSYLEPVENSAFFSSEENLPFMSQEEAGKTAATLCRTLGFGDISVRQIYVMDQESLQQNLETVPEDELYHFNKETEEAVPITLSYTEEDDCYFLLLQNDVGNLSVLSSPHGNPDDDSYIGGFDGLLVLSERGVELLQISGHMSVEEKEEVQPLFPADKALTEVKNKFEQLLSCPPTTVERGDLVYVPEIIDRNAGRYRLVPAWCFSIRQQLTDITGSVMEQESVVLIHAFTGDEII